VTITEIQRRIVRVDSGLRGRVIEVSASPPKRGRFESLWSRLLRLAGKTSNQN